MTSVDTATTPGWNLPHAKLQLTPEEARRAIYIDFEGRKNAAPILLGLRYETGARFDKAVLRNYILDARFTKLGRGYGVPSVLFEARCMSLARACREVVLLARSRDRLIVSWSQHDGKIIDGAGLQDALANEFAERYRDGKATAKLWYYRYRSNEVLPSGDGRRPHTLANYMHLINYELPHERFGVGRTGTNLGLLEGVLERGRSWDDMTDRQQDAWIEVVEHNVHDCEALREVVIRATRELAYGRRRGARTGA